MCVFVYENISMWPMVNLLINLRYAPLASSHLKYNNSYDHDKLAIIVIYYNVLL